MIDDLITRCLEGGCREEPFVVNADEYKRIVNEYVPGIIFDTDTLEPMFCGRPLRVSDEIEGKK